MRHLGALLVAGIAVAFVLTQVHAYLGARADAAECAARIHSVPPQYWRGGVPPLVPDCP